MNLSEEQKEKLILGIQAVAGVCVLALSIKNSAKTQTAQMKKVLDKNARLVGRLHRKEYKQQKKLSILQYRSQLKKIKEASKAR